MQLYLVTWWRNARWLSALTGDRGTLAGNGGDAMVSQTMTATRPLAGYPRALLLRATLGLFALSRRPGQQAAINRRSGRVVCR